MGPVAMGPARAQGPARDPMDPGPMGPAPWALGPWALFFVGRFHSVGRPHQNRHPEKPWARFSGSPRSKIGTQKHRAQCALGPMGHNIKKTFILQLPVVWPYLLYAFWSY